MTDGSPCAFAGCGGTVDGGYCDSCGRAPRRQPAAAAAGVGPGIEADGVAPSGTGGPPAGGEPLLGSRVRGPGDAPAPPGPATDTPLRVADPAGGSVDGLGLASACAFAGCDGTVDGGYCDTCGRAPLARPALAGPPWHAGSPVASSSSSSSSSSATGLPPVGPPGGGGDASGNGGWHTSRPSLRPSSSRTSSSGRRSAARRGSGSVGTRRTGRTRLGLGLVDVPAVPMGDPSAAVMPVAHVLEDKRFCSNCNSPVGRARNHQSGRLEGFCPQCRTRFSFTPRLGPDDVVGGQYQVLGALAHGGLGWIYLARDWAVSDRWVVLKGLLDAASEEAAMVAVAERRFLAALDHPNIVRIHNFVAHEGAGYIVMEYIGGKSLKAILKDRRDVNSGRIDPLPVDRAIAYTLSVLPAMGYFHAQGLVYCDMKPDNVMLSGDSLKIIDLGGVCRADDEEAAIYGTVGYQAPEVVESGPTVASDLYTVGRMLAVLLLDFRGYQTTHAHDLPGSDEQPLLARHESLYRFLLKATATDPIDRFESAEEMAEQLTGVLREEVASHGEAHPAVSTVFEPGGVVGADEHDEVGPDWRLLPSPKVDTLDPGVGVVLGLADGEPAAVVAALSSALAADSIPATPETLLRLARAHLDDGMPEDAAARLDRLGDDREWRLWWHRGLIALACGRAGEAIDWLDPVYTDLPGEVPAKLALALAHELASDLGRSADLYDLASRTDPSYVSGAFGLARVRVALGDRVRAVEALDRVPATSSAHVAARLAAVRALALTTGPHAQPPTTEQLQSAAGILTELRLTPRHNAELAGALFEAGLAALAAGTATPGRRILGRPLTENGLRAGLESTYRDLARTASTTRERNDLVDLANHSRPRTLL
jgi:serine/threonine-protein kinase PknG